jgi:hypothetical protein
VHPYPADQLFLTCFRIRARLGPGLFGLGCAVTTTSPRLPSRARFAWCWPAKPARPGRGPAAAGRYATVSATIAAWGRAAATLLARARRLCARGPSWLAVVGTCLCPCRRLVIRRSCTLSPTAHARLRPVIATTSRSPASRSGRQGRPLLQQWTCPPHRLAFLQICPHTFS